MEKIPKSSSEGADVVVVADFDGPRSAVFELVTLLFLASWIEHRGPSRSWPLHLVCIGPPPATVRRLAREAGAALVSRPPLALTPKRTTNKLRGFEVDHATGQILLLDADTVVLRDLSPLMAVAGGAAGAAVAAVNHFPEDTWRRIYAAVDEPYPGPTGSCWCADPHLAALRGLDDEWIALCGRMPPYYNSGVVTAPWAADLGGRWREHLLKISSLFASRAAPPFRGGAGYGDEHALATALDSLRRAGVPVTALPDAYNTRPLLVRARPRAWEEARVVHHIHLIKTRARSPADLRLLLYGRTVSGLRRRIAAVGGLRAVASPATRGLAPGARRAFAPFFEYVHRLYIRRMHRVVS